MSAVCLGQPVSFLRLERYLLGELRDAELDAVQSHLGTCEVCRASCDELRASVIELPPLPDVIPEALPIPRETSRPPGRFHRWPLAAAASSALALAAAVLLMVRKPAADAELPHARTPIKGGELALSLVRERNGDIAREPDHFSAGDRFQVRVSCPPTVAPAHWDVVVLQGGDAFFPLPSAGPIACGNQVSLPGAFQLDGREPANVCVALSERGALDRNLLARSKLPSTSACVLLRPQQ